MQLGRFTFKHIKSIMEQTISITVDEMTVLTDKWYFHHNMKMCDKHIATDCLRHNEKEKPFDLCHHLTY